MNNRQESKLRMYRETDMVLDNNKSSAASIPALAKEAANLKSVIALIDELHPQQAIDTKGVTTSKNQLREDITENVNTIAGALFSYGTHKNDNDLCQRVNVYPSTLLRASIADFNRICSEIVTECDKAGAGLSDYGITAEMVTGLKSRLSEFKSASVLPRNARVEISTATSNLEELFAKADDILLNHIDVLMLQFKASDPEFYKNYSSARIIEDRGSRKPKDKKAKEAPAA